MTPDTIYGIAKRGNDYWYFCSSKDTYYVSKGKQHKCYFKPSFVVGSLAQLKDMFNTHISDYGAVPYMGGQICFKGSWHQGWT